MDFRIGEAFPDDYVPEFDDDDDDEVALAPPKEPQAPRPPATAGAMQLDLEEPVAKAPAAPEKMPDKMPDAGKFDFGPAFPDDYQPDFDEELDEPSPSSQVKPSEPVPGTYSSHDEAVPAIPPPGKSFGADWGITRGFMSSLISGNLESAGGTAEVLDIVSGGDKDSVLGKMSTYLGEAAKATANPDYKSQVPSISDVGSIGELGTYLAERGGEAAGSTLLPIAGMGIGAGAGASVGGPVGAAVGGFSGAMLPSFVQNVGGTWNEFKADEGVKRALDEGKLTKQQAGYYALGAGTAIAALDAVGVGEVMRVTGLTKEAVEPLFRQGVKRVMLKAALHGGAAESATEAAQQVISEALQAYVGGDLKLKERITSVFDSAVGGFLLGGTTSAGGAGVNEVRKPKLNDQGTDIGEGAIPAPSANEGSSTPGGASASSPPPPAGVETSGDFEGYVRVDDGAPPQAAPPSNGSYAAQEGSAKSTQPEITPPGMPASDVTAAAAAHTGTQAQAPKPPVTPGAAELDLTQPTAQPATNVDPDHEAALKVETTNDNAANRRGPVPQTAGPAGEMPRPPGGQPPAGPGPAPEAQTRPPAPIGEPPANPAAQPPLGREPAPAVQTRPTETPAIPPQGSAGSSLGPTSPSGAPTTAGQTSFEPSTGEGVLRRAPSPTPASTIAEDVDSDVISESAPRPVPRQRTAPTSPTSPAAQAPKSAARLQLEKLIPPDSSFTLGEPFEDGYVPDFESDLSTALDKSPSREQPSIPRTSSAVPAAAAPGQGLSKSQQTALDNVTTDLEELYDQSDPRLERDLNKAREFISQQPVKQPAQVTVGNTFRHLGMRAGAAAEARAAAAAPQEREARRARLAADEKRRAETAPQREQEERERRERLKTAEASLTPEEAAKEGGPSPSSAEMNKQLDDMIRDVLEREMNGPYDPADPSLEKARTEAGVSGGGKGGGTGNGGGSGSRGAPRPPSAIPGTPQFKATRIVRRASRAGLRHMLRAGNAKTRRSLRHFVADHDLTTDNEWRFNWTDRIDPESRTEANPMRQVSEARSREAAKREKLAVPFKKIVDRLDRLRRRNPQAYQEMARLMMDSSALKVDPTKPLAAPENDHLGRSFSQPDYQGYRAHPILAERYEALEQQDPEIADLWADLQDALAKRREHETRTRVTALIRQVLDRANERARADGKTPPPTGPVEAEQLADRVIDKKLTKTDREMLSPSVQMALQLVIDAGKIPGTYVPFLRQGNFAVSWAEPMKLPGGATWVKGPNGKPSDDTFTADNATTHKFVQSTLDDSSPNAGLIIRQIRAFKEGPDGKPVFRNEVTKGEFDALTTPVEFEVQVQRRGMSLHNTHSEAEAAREEMEKHAEDVTLQQRDENDTSDLIPANIDKIMKKAMFDLKDTATDDSVVELLDKTMRDAVASVAAGNAASARRLHRKNVSGAEDNIGIITDRYADASSGAIAKLEALPELEAGMRGMRYSDEEQSKKDPKGQLARQQMISEWERRVSDPNDHYTAKGTAENTMQAALNVSFLTRLGDISSALVDLTQPYIMGASRLIGRTNPYRAYLELAKADKAINSLKVAGKSVGDAGKSTGEALTKGGAAIARVTGAKDAEGARFGRTEHFDDIRKSVGSEKDGRDLQKMLDELADASLLSRESAVDVKGLDPDELRGLNRLLEPLSDIFRQLRVGVDIQNQAKTAVAAYRIARGKGDTHKQAMEWTRDVVRQSQFDSTQATRAPAFKQRGVAKIPLQFKQFTANAIVGMARMMRAVFYPKNMTPAQKTEWRRVFAAANIVTLAAVGVSNHPLAMIAGTFLQLMALAMGEPPREWEGEMEEWFTRMFSEELGMSEGASHKAAATIMRGLPSGLGPVDIAKRIGFGDLIVQGKPESMDAKGISNWLGQQILGAPGDTAVSPVDAGKAILNGDVSKAVELLTPKFIANLVRASRGGPVNAKGEPLTEEGYSVLERIAKGIGLQPTSEADLRRQRTYNYSQNELRKVKEAGLRKAFEDAENYGEKHKAWLKIQRYNENVPDDAQITDKSLKRRQNDLLKDREKVAGDMSVTKKNRDIGERSKRLNPADNPPRDKVIEYDFE